MKFWKKNDGITLVELMVSMAIGVMIFAAASTVLILGFRTHSLTTASVTSQYTARTVITLLEDMATEGEINAVHRSMDGSWKVGVGLKDPSNETMEQVFLSYSAEKRAIYTGDVEEPILENIVASYVVYDQNTNILTIALEDHRTSYTSAVYCRKALQKQGNGFEDIREEDVLNPGVVDQQKLDFLRTLYSQLGTNGGIINHKKEPANVEVDANGNEFYKGTLSCDCQAYDFFSEWYLKKENYMGYTGAGWGPDTPWCACFVSWGLWCAGLSGPNETDDIPGEPRWFANVDAFMDYFTEETTGGWDQTPAVADLVFFNMIDEDDSNPSHIGVVIEILNDNAGNPAVIRTIEGNSADMVAIREYSITDSHILGYGDPWQVAP